jgi:hypothetical protein
LAGPRTALAALPCGGDGVQGPPAPAAAGWAVDA